MEFRKSSMMGKLFGGVSCEISENLFEKNSQENYSFLTRTESNFEVIAVLNSYVLSNHHESVPLTTNHFFISRKFLTLSQSIITFHQSIIYKIVKII